jgi:hypothetical protein
MLASIPRLRISATNSSARLHQWQRRGGGPALGRGRQLAARGRSACAGYRRCLAGIQLTAAPARPTASARPRGSILAH